MLYTKDMTAYVDNILSVFDQATDSEYKEGMTWYNKANAWCWGIDHLNYKRAAGVLAALSPMLSWDLNVRYAEMVYAGKTRIPCLQKNAAKAIAIKNGWNALDILSGPKVTAFYHNIVNPYSDDYRYVTIDRQAIDIANGYAGSHNNAYRKVHEDMAIAYVDAAHEIGILPLQMQAVTWVTWRNLKREGLSSLNDLVA